MIKHGLKRAPASNFIYNFCKKKYDFSVSDSITRTPIVRNQYNRVQQSKAYSRFPQKVKEFELPSPGVVSSSLSPRIGLVSWYLGMIKSRPIITKSVTCSLIYTAADLSSQTISQPSSESYDLVRTLRMAAYGLLILGPSLHFWFNFVSKTLPKRDVVTTLKKIALGQTVYGPMMNVVFFSVNAAAQGIFLGPKFAVCLGLGITFVFQGESGTEIVARLKRDLIPTMITGVMYWPMCDFVTFKFIPVHLQPLVSNGFSYLWTIYITYMANRKKVAAS